MQFCVGSKRGYDFGEVSSATQKAIRRADTRLAGDWALELWQSGFGNYVRRRLLYGMIVRESDVRVLRGEKF